MQAQEKSILSRTVNENFVEAKAERLLAPKGRLVLHLKPFNCVPGSVFKAEVDLGVLSRALIEKD